MKRREPTSQTGTHSAKHCRAVVLVDGSNIRKKIKKEYEKALRAMEKSRGQLDQFHQTDLPQFVRWLNARFGASLTELRDVSQRLSADEAIISDVEREIMFRGGSSAGAYKRVMELRENPEPHPPPGGDGNAEGEGDPFDAPPEPESFDDEKTPLEELFEALFGELGEGWRPGSQYAAQPGHGAGPGSASRASSRLKDIYRALVRRLHPDTQQEMTAQKMEWWHQAQAAYEAGDAEQLEVILTLCEIGDTGTTAHTSASLLQRITAKLKSSLREIKRQISKHRTDPAWNFSARSDHDVLAIEMHRKLTVDLQEMRGRLQQTQEIIARWKTAVERLKQPRRRKHHAQNMDLPF